jgi:hypothetical protein
MKNRTKKKLIASSFLLSLALVYMGTTHTLGWFDNRINSPVELVVGQSTSAYFYDGKGTKDDPYIITNRRHLYNLAWLQYIGHFNQASEDGVITPVYFKVATTTANSGATTTDTKYTTPADIDCEGLVLPPIGTSQYPFVGIFDGNDSVIRNYTVTDKLADMTNAPNEIRNNATYKDDSGTLKHCSIIGTFGVVGLLDDKVKAVDSSNSSSTTFTISGGVKTDVSNFYVDQVTIKPTASNTLAGLIVGYANANVSYCGAYRSKIAFNSGTSKLDVKVSSDDAFSNVSSYTLIGDYNPDAVSWSDRPGQGQQNDWGGSIDIASFAKRINYIAKSENSGNTPSQYGIYTSTNFNAKLYYSRSFNWDTTYKSGQYVGLMDGTYLPLNINLETATISGSYSGDMGSYYTSGSHTGEPILSTNTGYIVGKNTSGGSATPRFHNKTFDSSSNGIPFSVNVTDQGGTIDSTDADGDGIFDIFSYDNISFFYVDTSTSTTYRVLDSENSSKTWSNKIGSTSSPDTVSTIDVASCGFGDLESGYYNVKHQFAKMLSEGNTSTTLSTKTININGIQIYGGSSNKTITKGTYSNVIIHNQKIDSYEMLQGGFNFELEKSGSIKLVVGPYTSSSTAHIFPSLYKVERSDDLKTISSYKKINAIYSLNGKYYSQYSDNSATIPTGATKIFDLTSLYGGGTLKQNGAYYIEIPLDSGDYWFGPDSADNKCPYILYFDIGANAGDSTEETKEYSISKIDFVYSNDASASKPSIYLINADGYVVSNVTFSLNGTSTSQTFYFYRLIEGSGDSATNTVYYYRTTTDGLTIAPSGSGTSSSDSKATWTVSSSN